MCFRRIHLVLVYEMRAQLYWSKHYILYSQKVSFMVYRLYLNKALFSSRFRSGQLGASRQEALVGAVAVEVESSWRASEPSCLPGTWWDLRAEAALSAWEQRSRSLLFSLGGWGKEKDNMAETREESSARRGFIAGNPRTQLPKGYHLDPCDITRSSVPAIFKPSFIIIIIVPENCKYCFKAEGHSKFKSIQLQSWGYSSSAA